MAINYDQIELHIRRMIKPALRSAFITTKPLLAFMASQLAINVDKLGTPNMRVQFGGARLGRAQQARLDGSYNCVWRFQKNLLDATEVGSDSTTPSSTQFADDAITSAETRNVLDFTPIKIRQSRLNKAQRQGDLAVGNLIEESTDMLRQQPFRKLQSRLWTGTLTESQQEAEEWQDHLGLRHICSDGESTGETSYQYYGGRDRTASGYDHIQGNLVDADDLVTDGYMSSTVPTLAMIRTLRYNNNVAGIANKDPMAGQLAITTSDLWNKLADEAEGDKQIQVYDTAESVQRFGNTVGWQYPVIVYGQTYITYDPDCDEGFFHLLTPNSFMFEVMSDNNFKIEEWQPKWLNEEGGGYYRWTQMVAETRFSCFDPHLQVAVKDLTTS